MTKFLIIIVSALLIFSSPAFAALYKCTNEEGKIEYKDKPCSNGNQEQLQQKSTGSPNPAGGVNAGEMKNFQESSIKYLDNLKKCNPFTHSYELPLFGKGKNIIVGRNSERCHVIMNSDISGKIICNFSDETIALLTSKKKYQEIREGEFSGGSDAEGARMTAECTFPNL